MQFDPSTMMFTVKGKNFLSSDSNFLKIPIVLTDVYGATNTYE